MKTKPPEPDPVTEERTRIRTILQKELTDFENQKASFYAQMMLADGAAQSCRALLKELDAPTTPTVKEPTP
jgi:hypothetical protein